MKYESQASAEAMAATLNAESPDVEYFAQFMALDDRGNVKPAPENASGGFWTLSRGWRAR